MNHPKEIDWEQRKWELVCHVAQGLYAGNHFWPASEVVQRAEDIIATYKERMSDSKKGGMNMNEQMTANAWVARDKDGTLWIYNYKKPQKRFSGWDTDEDCMSMLQDQLNSVKWEDKEPTEVEIIIKLKEQ